jgi:hypothetical protein
LAEDFAENRLVSNAAAELSLDDELKERIKRFGR